jgi:cytochrome c556
MKTARSLVAILVALPLLASCCCSGGHSSAPTGHQQQQMKATNLQTLNAGSSATLPGD